VVDVTAITAIGVTGLVGLGAPAIAAHFQRRRDRERRNEERWARDLAELRGVFDDMAASLDQASRSASLLLRSFLERGVGYGGLAQLIDTAHGDLDQARLALARLSLRLPLEDGAGHAAKESVTAIERALHDIAAARLFGEDPPREVTDRMVVDGERWAAEGLRFLDEARALIAPTVRGTRE
jgi:hypothetical protein